MLYNLQDETVLANIVEIYESTENVNRIDKHLNDYQLAFGNQGRFIAESLQKRYPESWQAMTIVNLQIAGKIIRKLSRCYATGVQREVVSKDGTVKNERLTSLLNYIYSDVDENGRDFNEIMSRTNILHANHRYVEIFCYIDTAGKIRFKPLPQHMVTAIPNEDKTKAEVIIFKQTPSFFTDPSNFIDWNLVNLKNPATEVMGVYTIWSKEQHFTFAKVKITGLDVEDKSSVMFKYVISETEENPNKVNPYGVLPFAQVKENTDGHFYPYGSEIATMSREINIILSDLVTIAAQQGFGQAVVYYDGDAPPQITKTGPTHVIVIPNKQGSSKFEFANANPDLAGHLNVALTLTRMLLTTNDLTTDKVSGELSATNFASGIDRLIADSETVESINDQRKKYIMAEQNVFHIIQHMLAYMMETRTMPIDYPTITIIDLQPDLWKVNVKFNDIKPLSTEKDRADTINFLAENGFILPYEKHQKFNEGMSVDEAKAREEIVEAIRKQRQQEYFAQYNQQPGMTAKPKKEEEQEEEE